MTEANTHLGLCAACRGPLQLRFPSVVDPNTRERFPILACSECGLGQISPQPADLSPYYAETYYGGRHGFTANHCLRRRTRWVDSLFGAGENRKLLDIGCGDGSFLLAAQQQGWRGVGTEMNPEPARETGLDVFPDVASAAALGPFDCITLWHSLEHVRDPSAILRDCKKILKPGGVLLIAVPDAGGLEARTFGARWFHLDVPRHLFHFTRKSLASVLRAAGFAGLRSWHQEFEYDLLGWSQSALNAMGFPPNLFFHALTGRKLNVGKAEVVVNWVLGAAFSALALPLVPLAALLGRGGTLIVAAKPE
ncbi:MAG: class I SAM-dependent methyltransferase [Candidatus Acidiferrales bacterium]